MYSKLFSPILILFLSLNSYSQTWEWTKQYGINHLNRSLSIIIDDNNNYYTSGYLGIDGVILKHNQNGDTIWSRLAGQSINSIAYRDGFIYASGKSSSGTFMYMRLDTSGVISWLNETVNDSEGISVVADTSGYSSIVGIYNDSLILGSDTLIPLFSYDHSFLAHFDASGNCILLKTIGTSASVNSLTKDAAGNHYLTGSFRFTCQFDSFTHVSDGATDIFISKLDPSGNCTWVKKAGSPHTNFSYSMDKGYAISTSPSGNLYVTGSCTDTSIFEGVILTSNSTSDDVFVAKYDTNGNLIWVNRYGSNIDDEGRCITVDNSENIYVGGSHVYPIAFGATLLPYTGDCDIFVTKFDLDGNTIWAVHAGGQSWDDFANGIAIDQNNDVIFTGMFYDTAFFGSDTLTSYGYSDFYISKLSNPLASVSEDDLSQNINIYPNPSSGIFTIELNNKRKGESEICVYSVTGQLIKKQIENSDRFQIDMSDFGTGIYLLKVRNKNSVITKRIIKQ